MDFNNWWTSKNPASFKIFLFLSNRLSFHDQDSDTENIAEWLPSNSDSWVNQEHDSENKNIDAGNSDIVIDEQFEKPNFEISSSDSSDCEEEIGNI